MKQCPELTDNSFSLLETEHYSYSWVCSLSADSFQTIILSKIIGINMFLYTTYTINAFLEGLQSNSTQNPLVRKIRDSQNCRVGIKNVILGSENLKLSPGPSF